MFSENVLRGAQRAGARAELQDEPRIPGTGWNYGYRGAVEWAEKLHQSFGALCFEIDEPSEAGDCVVTQWHAVGEGKRSGVKVAMAGYCLFGLARGKVCRVEFFESESGARCGPQAVRVTLCADGHTAAPARCRTLPTRRESAC